MRTFTLAVLRGGSGLLMTPFADDFGNRQTGRFVAVTLAADVGCGVVPGAYVGRRLTRVFGVPSHTGLEVGNL